MPSPHAGFPVIVFEEQLLAAVGELRGIEAANRLCEVCVTALGVQAAAISAVHRGNNVATLGASSAAARAYDEVQFTAGEGPCLDSVARRAPVGHHARYCVDAPDLVGQHRRAVQGPPGLGGIGQINDYHGRSSRDGVQTWPLTGGELHLVVGACRCAAGP
jgi:hypothetical protein